MEWAKLGWALLAIIASIGIGACLNALIHFDDYVYFFGKRDDGNETRSSGAKVEANSAEVGGE